MNMNNQEKNSYVREHMLEALMKMLQETPISDITVSDLVQKAGVGRASFYRNFTTVEDILIQEERRLFDEWNEKYQRVPESERSDFTESLLNFYKANEHFYLTL